MKKIQMDIQTMILIDLVKNCTPVTVPKNEISITQSAFKKICLDETNGLAQFFKPVGVNYIIIYKKQDGNAK